MRCNATFSSRMARASFRPVALFLATCAGMYAVYMQQQYIHSLERARADNVHSAKVLSDKIATFIAAVDKTLDDLAGRSVHCQPIGIIVQGDALDRAQSSLGGAAGLSVLDANGTILFSTVSGATGQNRSDRPLFRALASTNSQKLAVDTPFRSPISNKVLIPLGRSLHSEGAFCGAVVASVMPERLGGFLTDISAAGKSITVLQSGTPVAQFGEPKVLDSSWIVGTEQVGDIGLSIAVSSPRVNALNLWHSDLRAGLAVLVVLAIGLGLLSAAHRRSLTAQDMRERILNSRSETQRLLFETTQDIILVLDDEKKVLQASPSIELVVGAAPRRGDALPGLLPDAVAQLLGQALAGVRAGAPVMNLETLIEQHGRRAHVAWSCSWSENDSAFYLIGRDRTEIKSREELLVRQNRQLDAALENMAQGLAMFDPDQRIVIANDKFATMYGQDPSCIVPGTPLADIIAHRIDAGIYVGTTVDAVLKKMKERVARQTTSHITSAMGDGRTIAVSIQPQQDGGWVTTHLDITERERLKDRLDAAINNMPQGLVMFDSEFKLVLCNRRYLELYNLAPEDAVPGTSALDILRTCANNGVYTGRDPEAMYRSAHRRINDQRVGYYETVLADGRIYGVSVQPMADGGIVGTHEDITERRRIEAQIAHLAHHDALTGLGNRLVLRERLDGDLAAGKAVAVLYLDLDRFKIVNDTLGHSVGDGLLQRVAQNLRSVTGTGDTLVRLGGDEFAVLHYSENLLASSQHLARRIILALSEPFEVASHSLRAGASIGIAIAPDHGSDAETLLRHADLALYAAKNDSRGTYALFERSMSDRLLNAQVLEMELQQAISKCELQLVYQPIYEVTSGSVAGCEALLRWKHQRRGFISPADFIPVAEQSGLIVEIGAWVLREACREAATWPKEVKVAINLSPIQLNAPDFMSMVRSTVDASGLDPSRLEFEITESTLLRDTELVLGVLEELRNMGAQIALDDFGTGYSSLCYLQKFPFSKIKVDRSFVALAAGNNPSAAAILRTIAYLCNELDVLTTVEGVETLEQLEFVKNGRFDQVQGYLFSTPKAPEELPWKPSTASSIKLRRAV